MDNFSARLVFRQLVAIALAAVLIAPEVSVAQAPASIKLVVPYPPGGSVDALARFLQAPLQEQLERTVIVENRPGAGGRIAASQLKREPADGSVVLIAPNALTTIQSLVYSGRLDYDVLEDFTAVSKLAAFPLALAVPTASGVGSLAELKDTFKVRPALANYGTSGAGGLAHFAGLVLAKSAGLEWNHVPFKGGAPLMTDLIGNHIAAGIDSLVDQIEHQRAGKIRILGIFAPGRYALAPDIPTLAEQGVGGLPAIEGWFGAFVSSRTPKEAVARLDQAIGKILAMPQLKEKLNRMVIEVSYLPSAEFSRLQAQELQQWAPTVRASGFRPE